MSEEIGYKSAQAYNEKLQEYTKKINNLMLTLSQGGIHVKAELTENKAEISETKIPVLKVGLSVPIREKIND